MVKCGGVVYRPQDALGLLGAADIEPAVDGADDEIEIAEASSGRSRLPSSRIWTSAPPHDGRIRTLRGFNRKRRS